MMIGRKIIDVPHQIDGLVRLQNYVNREYKLHLQKKAIQDGLDRFKAVFQQSQKQYEIAQQDLKTIKSEANQLEKQLQLNREQLSQLKDKEKFIQTQKEYVALDAEEQLKKEKVKELTQLLDQKHNKQIDFENKLDEIKQQFTKAKAEYDQQIETHQDEVNKLDDRLNKFKDEKQSIVDSVDHEILNRFERIVASKAGIGIVPVINGSCEGCNILVAPVIISKIRSCKEMVVCINCSRILYLPSLPSIFD